MITFKKYVENLNQVLKNNPELANLPVVYAEDDEGNGYSLVSYETAIPLQFHDITDYPLELVGFYDQSLHSDLTIDKKDINAVLIN